MLKYIKRIHPKAQTGDSFKSIITKLQTRGLFKQDQTYVIYEDKAVMDIEVKDLMKIIGGHTVILVYSKIDERTKFAKNIKEHHFEFKKFNEEQLANIVEGLIATDSFETSVMIARYCGNDVARIESECHKLKHLYPPEMNMHIIELDVERMIVPPLEDKIFEMIDSTMKRNPKRVFKIYKDMLEMKESPIKVISLLYTKFKQVFLVQSMSNLQNNDIAAKTGMSFFQVDMARKLIGHFQPEDLLRFLQMIQRTEVDMKTGQVDIDLGMENLFIDILT
jgi:DNA polymerase-3 subunit delta